MADELDARAAGARRLRDKVCVVTGAGQGIGRAAARRLGQEGGKIVVADRVEASAARTEAELRDEGDEAQAEDYRREMAQDIRNQQAVQRRGLPEEQAAAIAFLASDDASFITGQVINCSGGQS